MGVKEKIGRFGEIRSVNFLDKTITLSLSYISIFEVVPKLWGNRPNKNFRK